MRRTRGVWSKALVLGAVLVILGVGGSGDLATAGKPRFVDNGDGTITDKQTGLMWETKMSGGGGPRDVNNAYTWSSSESAPDGTLFTDFLPKINCEVSADGTCPLTYGDWRIPTVAELRTIQDCSFFPSPCIDPIFGPTGASNYWSSSSLAGSPASAWTVKFFRVGFPDENPKGFALYARAVRGGS